MRPTLLRKYWKTAMMAAAGHMGDSRWFLADYLLRILRVVVLLSIWRMIFAQKGPVSGMTAETVLTYTLIAEVFREQLVCRAGIESTVWEGTMVTRLLQPLGFTGIFAAEMFGRWCFSFVTFSVPLLLLAPLLGVNPLPASLSAAGLFVVSLALAISVGLAVDFIFGALIVWLGTGIWLIDHFRDAVSTLLSGSLLPLALLPWGLGQLIAWLPFAAMASAPLQIYTGTGDPFRLLLTQMAWSVALWPAAHALWRANRERLVGYGG